MAHELLDLENSSDIVSFTKLYRMVWRMKWFIILVTVLFTFIAAYLALQKPNVYTAKSIYVPAQNDSSGGLSQLAGQFGGLASMAGINIGGGKGDNNAIAIELLKSRSFLQGFISKHKILPQLLAAKSWNKATNSLIYDEQIYNSKTHKWVRSAPQGFKIIPSTWEAYDKMLSLIKIEYKKKKGMIIISLITVSPHLSAKWLAWLIEDLNTYWREKDKKQAEESIKYLQQQVRLTNIAEMQQIFYTIIAEQTKQVLLTEVSKEYLFKTLTPIVTPEQKSAPSRALITIVGAFLGGLFSLLLSFIYVSIYPVKDD
ncbi:MAG: LPS O-antigen length regulator [Alteromonadaceae bacterium]|nr:LPS O-antigen length regulator [Alteromonadaceae bacterium]